MCICVITSLSLSLRHTQRRSTATAQFIHVTKHYDAYMPNLCCCVLASFWKVAEEVIRIIRVLSN
jgi:hypothetical protein